MSNRNFQKDKPTPNDDQSTEIQPDVKAEKRRYVKKDKMIEIPHEAPKEISASEAVKIKPKREMSEAQKANVARLVEATKLRCAKYQEIKKQEQEQAEYERLKKLQEEGKILVKVAPKPPKKTIENHWSKKVKKTVSTVQEDREDEDDDEEKPKRSVSPAVREQLDKVNNLIKTLEDRVNQRVVPVVQKPQQVFVSKNPYDVMLQRMRENR